MLSHINQPLFITRGPGVPAFGGDNPLFINWLVDFMGRHYHLPFNCQASYCGWTKSAHHFETMVELIVGAPL